MTFDQKSSFVSFFVTKEILYNILGFAGPISFIKLSATFKRGTTMCTHIPDIVKKEWMLLCQNVLPDDLNDECWWMFAYGLVLKLNQKKHDEWEGDDWEMMQCLLCGIWKWWNINLEELLVKILSDIQPPKRLLGKVLLRIYCDMYIT